MSNPDRLENRSGSGRGKCRWILPGRRARASDGPDAGKLPARRGEVPKATMILLA